MLNLFKRLRIPLLLIALLAITATVVSRYTSLNWLIENDRWLRQQIVAAPITSFFLALVFYLIASLIPGLAGKSIVLGWFFGVVVGVVIVNCALVGAALIAFLLCRHYLQDVVEARLGFYLRPFQRRMHDDGAWYMLMLRLAHVPFSFTNYAAGAGTQIPFRTFWWTTQLGLLPGNVIFVYAGARLPTLEELVRLGPIGLLDGPMVAALIGTVILPFVARKLIAPTSRHQPPVRQLPQSDTDCPDEEN